MKKFIIEKHYRCKICGGCFFSSKESAENCYNEHTIDEIKESTILSEKEILKLTKQI